MDCKSFSFSSSSSRHPTGCTLYDSIRSNLGISQCAPRTPKTSNPRMPLLPKVDCMTFSSSSPRHPMGCMHCVSIRRNFVMNAPGSKTSNIQWQCFQKWIARPLLILLSSQSSKDGLHIALRFPSWEFRDVCSCSPTNPILLSSPRWVAHLFHCTNSLYRHYKAKPLVPYLSGNGKNMRLEYPHGIRADNYTATLWINKIAMVECVVVSDCAPRLGCAGPRVVISW